ncbi:MAG: aspartate kinase [Promethearchaeota archaeon]
MTRTEQSIQLGQTHQTSQPGPEFIVMKFGGSCLAQPKDFQKLLQIIVEPRQNSIKSKSLFIVVSALQGVTDMLIKVTEFASKGEITEVFAILDNLQSLHGKFIETLFAENLKARNLAHHEIQELLGTLALILEEVEEFGVIPYFIDYISSFGEKLCAKLLHLFLCKEGLESALFYGEDLIITNDEYLNALPDFEHTYRRVHNKLLPILEKTQANHLFCITGFIGRNKIGYTTTLGRGGSDFTATILARMLFETKLYSTGKIILWKDVDGLLSGNPEFIESPRLIRRINYREAKEIAVLGAKILHPKCLAIIENQEIPVEIRNFQNPESGNFTTISVDSTPIPIKGIELWEKRTLITFKSAILLQNPAFLAKVFQYFAEKNISCLWVLQSISQNTLSLLVDEIDQDINHDIIHDSTHAIALDKNSFSEQFLEYCQFPHDWIEIILQETSVVTIISEERYQSYILQQLGALMSDITVNGSLPYFIVQESSGISTSLLIPHKYLLETANAINLFSDVIESSFASNIQIQKTLEEV